MYEIVTMSRNIFLPFGKYYGLKDRKVTVPENGLLEEAFNKSLSGCLNQAQVQVLAKKIDWSQNQVERWIAKRKAKDRPSPLVKIMESGWGVTYYTTMVIYGICVLWNKPYLWNFDECWINYPFQVSSSKGKCTNCSYSDLPPGFNQPV